MLGRERLTISTVLPGGSLLVWLAMLSGGCQLDDPPTGEAVELKDAIGSQAQAVLARTEALHQNLLTIDSHGDVVRYENPAEAFRPPPDGNS